MQLYSRLRKQVDRKTLAFVTKINIYGLGLSVLWTVVDTTLLPTRVDQTAPSSLAGSALGLITFLGVGFAVVVQPLAGRVSDAWPGDDKRRPFIIAGTLLVIPGLVLFGAAPSFFMLLAGFVLMQFATNISQAAYQAFIPDLVKSESRGIASGAKNMLSVVGVAGGLLGAQALFNLDASGGLVVVYIGSMVILTGVLTLRWMPRIPSDGAGDTRSAVRTALDVREFLDEAKAMLREHVTFRLAVLAQFLFMLGTYPAQRFLLLFLRDRFGGGAIGLAATGGVIAVILAVASAAIAGALSDVIGRIRVLIGSAIIGGAGLALIGFSPTIGFAAIAGGLIAVALGAFRAVNWALLNDDLPEGQAAGALGIANIATAGAGALAGLYGPIVDVMNAFFPPGTYEVLFGLAGLVTVLALLPLRRITAHSSG